MDNEKAEWIKAQGFEITTVESFLDLTPEESAFIEFKLRMAKKARDLRKEKALTQKQVAELLETDQARISRIENAHDSVSLDTIFQSLFALGIDEEEIASAILAR